VSYLSVEAAGAAIAKRLKGCFTQQWTYYNADGTEAFKVLRFDECKSLKGDKTYRPIHRDGGGYVEGDPPGPLPLYNQPELLDNRNDPVSLQEGEKAAEAARSIGLLTTTWAHGAESATKTDFRPLAGRDVWLFPDNDAAGRKARAKLCDILLGLDPPARVRVITLAGLPEGGDIFDWLEERDAIEPEALRAQILTMAKEAKAEARAVAQQGKPNFEAVTINLACVKPEPFRWLWPERIPLGGVTLIVGNPGEGKSTGTMRITANVTTGEAWPDRPGETRPPGGVVLLTAEDRLADVVVPRLMAAEAALSRIEAISAIKEYDNDGMPTMDTMFDISRHTDALQAVIDRQRDTALVIIDPVTAFLGKTDSHKNAEVRRVLARLATLAERNQVAVICVSHLNKNTGQSSSNRIIGSIAFNATARAVWHVTRDPDDSNRRLFLPGKNSYAKEPRGLAFRLIGTRDGDIKSVKAVFEAETVYTTIDDLLTPNRNADGNAITKVDDAATWLRDKLAQGERLSATLIEQGREDDFSRDTLFKAKNRIGVRARKVGFGKDSQWFWALPSDNGDL
jgi:KaiC/GvpD/RAD55 family RecA-like ATPase